jgi:hypothetical protein
VNTEAFDPAGILGPSQGRLPSAEFSGVVHWLGPSEPTNGQTANRLLCAVVRATHRPTNSVDDFGAGWLLTMARNPPIWTPLALARGEC